MATPPRQRLHKHLADLGVASRRTIERWIEQERITVNDRVAQLGEQVDRDSRISIDGEPLQLNTAPRKRRVLLYNKPEGEISTRKDPRNRPTVYQRLPKQCGERWVAVGRLDINTRGLLLFTNDGELANRLMHPRFGVEREYLCRVYGRVDGKAIERLEDGIMLDGRRVRFHRVRQQRDTGNQQSDSKNRWYSVVVGEGRYREVRRMWEAVGCQLSRLMRVRYGELVLPKSLKPGQWQELKPAAVARLLQPRKTTAPADKKASPAPRK